MDALRYAYKAGTNQLQRVDDDVVPLDPNRYQDVRPATAAPGTAQYTYDAIGNLTGSANFTLKQRFYFSYEASLHLRYYLLHSMLFIEPLL